MGANILGRISDQTVIKWRRMRKGKWYPEDRLRAALIPLAIVVPLSVLTFGLVNKFIDGNLGLGLSLVCLFSTGAGVSGRTPWHIRSPPSSNYYQKVDMSFGAFVAYLVDVMHSRSSESLATFESVPFSFYFTDWNSRTEWTLPLPPPLAFSILRSTLIALSVAAFLPMIDIYGIAITNVMCAILIWTSFWYVE